MKLFTTPVSGQTAPQPSLPVEVQSGRDTPFHVADETEHQLLMELLKAVRMNDNYPEHLAQSGTAGVVETTYGFPLKQLSGFYNDGTDTLFLNFDDHSTLEDNVLTIKAGEKLTDFPRSLIKFSVRAATGSQAYRIFGVR